MILKALGRYALLWNGLGRKPAAPPFDEFGLSERGACQLIASGVEVATPDEPLLMPCKQALDLTHALELCTFSTPVLNPSSINPGASNV